MLVAYLDEFGHVGPYVCPEHKKFFHHPIFGYAGYVIPASNSREMGATFKHAKMQLFKTPIEKSQHPNQWERKGSEFFSSGSIKNHPEQARVFKSLVRKLKRLDGKIFFYGDEKQKGTKKETNKDALSITEEALRETINRLCTYAESKDSDIIILMDQITDSTRKELAAKMYAHIFGRSRPENDHPEMKRIIDAPLHIESDLNSGIQFADWICALMSRVSHWQFVDDSEFSWAPNIFGECLRKSFTHESKIHCLYRGDIHKDELLSKGSGIYKPETIGSIAKIPKEFYSKLAASSEKHGYQ